MGFHVSLGECRVLGSTALTGESDNGRLGLDRQGLFCH